MKYDRVLENKTRMTIQGKRYRVGNPNHPFHDIYKREGFEGVYRAMGLNYNVEIAKEIKRSVDAMFDEVTEGEVYIINNNVWRDWYKVGKAVSSEDRLGGYQTSSPFRDYQLVYYSRFTNRHVAESEIHKTLRSALDPCKCRGEWFNTELNVIIDIINSYVEEKQSNEETNAGHRDEPSPQYDLDLCN